MQYKQNIITITELYSVAGSIPTLNPPNKCVLYFVAPTSWKKLLLGLKAGGEKGAEIQDILQQPKEYLIFDIKYGPKYMLMLSEISVEMLL